MGTPTDLERGGTQAFRVFLCQNWRKDLFLGLDQREKGEEEKTNCDCFFEHVSIL